MNRLLKYHDKDSESTDSTVSSNDNQALLPENTALLSACAESVVSDTDHDESDELDPDNQLPPLPTLTLQCRSRDCLNINPHLTISQKQQIEKIISEFSDLITDIPGKAKVPEFKIELTSDKPIALKPYAVPIHMRDVLNTEIEGMLQLGIIEESDSPYASPVVLVKKKDNTIRTCVDYRKLNMITKFDAEVIPDQEDLFNQLHSSQYFTKLDLTKGFWQLPIEPSSRKYTAFKVPTGHFQFRYLPFGLLNSPSFFNRTIRNVLKGLSGVIFYFDDICVFSKDWDSHLTSLSALFNRLR